MSRPPRPSRRSPSPRHVAACLALLLLAACTSGRTPRLLAEGAPVRPEFVGELTVTPRNHLLVVPVTVGDRELRLLLDSGAPTAIGPRLRRDLGLRAVSRTEAADARGTRADVDVVRLPRVTLAGVGFDRIAAVVLDVAAVPDLRCLGVDGLLGANLMRQAAWQIDLGSGHLRFADRREKLTLPPGSRMARFITLDSGAPVLRPVLDGVPVPDMVLDTGANVGILAPTEALDTLDGSGARPRLEAMGSSGAAALGYGPLTGRTRFAPVRRVEIGDLQLRDRVVEFRDEASLLGTRFLDDYLVTLDWRRRAVWFTPSRTGPEEPETDFGFQVILQGESLVASRVMVSSPAWESGLRPGSVILTVDGESLSPISESRYCRILEHGLAPDAQGRIRLTFSHDGARRTVALPRFEASIQ